MPNSHCNFSFQILSQGSVVQSFADTDRPLVLTGPRCAVGNDGSVVCTYMAQSQLGINDFVPMITRSDTNLLAWSEPKPLWPHLSNQYSIFCNLSRSMSGRMFVFGSRTVIDQPGESFWCEQTKGLKANKLAWACSDDGGQTWCEPRAFALPYPAAAEAPGPLLVTRRSGRWVGVYSPYNLMGDKSVHVKRERVIAVTSNDSGDTWQPSVMIQFDEQDSGGAEAWVTQLSDGRLLGVVWQVDLSGQQRVFPNRYAISNDEGLTWSPTCSTGIMANTIALTPLDANRALLTTVRRDKGSAGIWISVVRPTANNFDVLSDQCVWSSTRPTRNNEQAAHDDWTEFTFGEPCVAVLSDGTYVLVFWYLNQSCAGIGYIRLRMVG